jgi:hypothetical protein
MVLSETQRRNIVTALNTVMDAGEVQAVLLALEALPEAEATPQATVSEFGTVKRATDPGELGGGATLGDVITAYNNLIIALRTSTVIQEAF